MTTTQTGGVTPPFRTKTPPSLHQSFKNMFRWSSKVVAKKLNSKGLVSLYFQNFLNKRKFEISIGIQINPKNWDEKSQSILSENNQEQDLNFILQQKKSLVNDILIECRLQNINLSIDEFKKRYNNVGSRQDFLVYFEQSINQRFEDGRIEESTSNVHKAVLNKCRKYKTEWFFSELDTEFLNKFTQWHGKYLVKNAVNIGKPLINNGQNTMMSALKIIKTYLNLARSEKIIFDMPKIKLKWVETSRQSLTMNEFKTLKDMYNSDYLMPNVVLHQSLEMFLFSCSTGLRISDIKKVERSHIENGFINIKAHKTRKDNIMVNIPINSFSAKIVKNKTGKIFSPLAEQTINEKLKTIAVMAGIEKNITMNVGRHTFATLWLQNGGNLKALQDLLGHKNIKTTQNYLHKDTDFLREQMKSFSKMFD